MRYILMNSVDWLSVKLNAICLLSFLTDSGILSGLAGFATLTTIVYNSIKIYKELKIKKRKKHEI